METSISGANHVVLHAQDDRWGFGPMETSISGANHVVLFAQSDRWGLGPIETCISGANGDVLNAKILSEVCDPYRFVILIQKSIFAC